MSALFTIGDTETPLTGTCQNNTSPADLTGAVQAVIHIRRPDRTVLTRDITGTTSLDTTGTFTCPLQAGDFTVPGTYQAEVVITWPTSQPRTFPGATFTVRNPIT